MKSIFTIFLFCIALSCSSQPKKIQINIATSKPGVTKDSIVLLTSSYFEIKLSSTTLKSGSVYYTTSKDIAKYYKSDKDFMFKSLFICEPDGKGKRFNSNVEFLDFMLAGGYEMVSQDKKKYAVDYTFKKK